MEASNNLQLNVVATRFGIDAELEQRVRTQAASFQAACRRTVEEAWKLGGELRQAKSQVRHGQWIPWVEGSIGLTPRTAQRLMALHEAYPEMRHVSHLPSVADALRPLLALPKSEGKHESEAAGATPVTGRGARALDDGRVVKATRELTRVADRLDSILSEEQTLSGVHRGLPALCDALQTLLSCMTSMVRHADSAADGETTATRELLSSLEATLARSRQVKDSVLAEREGRQWAANDHAELSLTGTRGTAVTRPETANRSARAGGVGTPSA